MKSNNNKISIPQLSKIVHLLGETLGLVVKNQEGKIYYDKIEEIRLLSKASRISNNSSKVPRPPGQTTIPFVLYINQNLRMKK